MSNNYFISCSLGDDTNDGKSIYSPWKSLANLSYTSFNPRDTIFLSQNCTWHENIVFEHSGRINEPIVITPYGKHTRQLPTITGSNSSGLMNYFDSAISLEKVIYLDNNIYSRSCDDKNQTLGDIYNLPQKLKGTSFRVNNIKRAIGIHIKGDFVHVINIQIQQFKKVGIKISGKNNVITSCQITNIPKTGIQMMGDSNKILNTLFYNIGLNSNPCCKGKKCGRLGNGVFIGLEKDNKKEIISHFSNNLINNCTFKNIGSFSGDHGVYDNGHFSKFIGNQFFNCVGTGIKLDGESSLVLNNYFEDCITAGILIDGGQNNEIIKNSLFNCGYYSKNWGQQGAIWYLEETPQTTKHKNGGGAVLIKNFILNGNISIKVSNSHSKLKLIDNKLEGLLTLESNVFLNKQGSELKEYESKLHPRIRIELNDTNYGYNQTNKYDIK